MGVVALRYLVLMTECHNSHKHSQGPLTTHYLTLTQLKYSLFYIFVFLQCAMVLFTLRATNTEKNYTYIIAEELIARYLTHKSFIEGVKVCKAHRGCYSITNADSNIFINIFISYLRGMLYISPILQIL